MSDNGTCLYKRKPIQDFQSDLHPRRKTMTCSLAWRRWAWRGLQKSGVAAFLNDELFIKTQYEVLTGGRLDLQNPMDFNQKLQWMKLYYKNPLLVTCSDKYAVREFVKERIGAGYLNDVIGLYSSVNEIPFSTLPNAFVLKATHGSGWNILCPDKARLDIGLCRRKIQRWLRSDFSRNGREWQYRQIPHRIVCETFLRDGTSPMLRDYKIFAFDGVCRYIWVDFEAGGSGADSGIVSYDKPKAAGGRVRYRNVYDTNWTFQPEKRILVPNCGDPGVSQPECLDEMLDVASKLSKGFPQCRVDLYVLDNQRIVFGELTFSSSNGCGDFIPDSFGKELGSYIVLPK
jgi:hypothetical protein